MRGSKTNGSSKWAQPQSGRQVRIGRICRLAVLVGGTLAAPRLPAFGTDRIDFAFVFGSLAALTETAESDVDLMVIGRIGLRELAPRLRGAVGKIGREINPHTYSREEFDKRSSNQPFMPPARRNSGWP